MNPILRGSGRWAALAVAIAAGLVTAMVWAGPGYGPGRGDGTGPADCPCGMHGRGGPHGPGGPGMGLRWMADRLDLTPDQSEKIHAIFDESFKTMEPLIEKDAAARDAVRDAIHADAIDEGAIRKAVSDSAAAGADLAVARAQTFQKIRAVLTPAQLDELKQMRGTMEQRRGVRREMRRERLHQHWDSQDDDF